ncbi:hypothetical protein [Rhodococcus qingshengii]|uniref:hypothetical protein n=1 Tax=Rhodococcus qingshengii TaxID=334542 RepID=UPI001AE0AB0F|nr:hypothetical protein [Rhodococcus qingshengii]MCQ4150273.1 hypothetical protein [Rhodococcus qingshengii]
MTLHINGDQATDMHVDRLRKRVEIRCLRMNHETKEWELVFCESHPLAEIQANLAEAS